MPRMKREFLILIEKGNDGYWIAEVPELQGCYTQAKTKPELMERVKEAIELCLEVQREKNVAYKSPVEIGKVVVHA